jgi:hypothetical protein
VPVQALRESRYSKASDCSSVTLGSSASASASDFAKFVSEGCHSECYDSASDDGADTRTPLATAAGTAATASGCGVAWREGTGSGVNLKDSETARTPCRDSERLGGDSLAGSESEWESPGRTVTRTKQAVLGVLDRVLDAVQGNLQVEDSDSEPQAECRPAVTMPSLAG